MKELIAIYLFGLLSISMWPSKVSSHTFVNISGGLQFKIDDKSPVISAEKDLIVLSRKAEPNPQARWINLNEEPRWAPRAPVVQVVDYSKDLRQIQTAGLVYLVGPIQLKQGLALTSDHRIEVHQEKDGKVIEYGDVDISAGTYAIQVEDLAGSLCAKLKEENAQVVGRGCVSLEGLKNKNRSLASGPLLSISKFQEVFPVAAAALPEIEAVTTKPSLAYKIYDFYGYDGEQPRVIENAKVDNSVSGQETATSYIITQIAAAGFATTRVVGGSNTARRGVPQLPLTAANAMTNIAKDAGYTIGNFGASGIMFGRVMKDGRTVAGAQITVDGRPDAQPLYFNELYIPDPNQKVTASHGLYTVMNLPDGEYSVRADIGNQFSGFQNASVRAGSVALADVESTFLRREVQLNAYELVSKTALGAVATLQNYHEDVIMDGGQAEISIPDAKDNSFAIIHPLNRNYLTAQFLMTPGQNQYFFPLIHKDWMEALLSQAKLSHALRGKIIMGIGAQEPFKAEAIGSQRAQIIYFDSNAQVVEGAFGPAGGGFLILDPEEESVEVAIQSAGKKEFQVYYMPTSPGVLSLIQM